MVLNRRPDASERLVELAEKIRQQQEALKNGAAAGAATASAAQPEWRKADVAERLSTALVKGVADYMSTAFGYTASASCRSASI